MSGGAFDYDQHRIRTIWETIQSIIKNNKKKDNFGYASNYSKKTLAEFERAISILKIAEVYAQRIDWLISGDDGEETFAERLAEDLAGIKAIPIEPPVKPANGGQIYLLYKRLLGYSDMTPILVAVFDDVEKALDQKYKLQRDDYANSYFIEDSRLSV